MSLSSLANADGTYLLTEMLKLRVKSTELLIGCIFNGVHLVPQYLDFSLYVLLQGPDNSVDFIHVMLWKGLRAQSKDDGLLDGYLEVMLDDVFNHQGLEDELAFKVVLLDQGVRHNSFICTWDYCDQKVEKHDKHEGHLEEPQHPYIRHYTRVEAFQVFVFVVIVKLPVIVLWNLDVTESVSHRLEEELDGVWKSLVIIVFSINVDSCYPVQPTEDEVPTYKEKDEELDVVKDLCH